MKPELRADEAFYARKSESREGAWDVWDRRGRGRRVWTYYIGDAEHAARRKAAELNAEAAKMAPEVV